MLLVAFILAGCSCKSRLSGVPFEQAQLSKAELSNLSSAHNVGVIWENNTVFRSVWKYEPIHCNVYMAAAAVSSGLDSLWYVVVLDQNGRILQQTEIIDMHYGVRPYRLIHPGLPVIVRFCSPSGELDPLVGTSLSPQEMQQRRHESALALEQAIASSTNTEVVASLRKILEVMTESETNTNGSAQPPPPK